MIIEKLKSPLFKKIMIILFALICATGIVLSCYYLIQPANGKVETFTVGDGETIRVGVFSDTQLPHKNSKGENQYLNNTKAALETMKEQKVDVILFAGDLTDFASTYAYKSYLKVFDEVFGDDAPITQYVMGNHDLWYPTDYASIAPKARLFKKNMRQSPNTHYVINGFHFIGLSPNKTSNTLAFTQSRLDWLEEQLEIAAKDTQEGQPIFVMTHHAPKDTMYGSDDWNDPGLDEVLLKYENVVAYSGHSHYSVLDERSIMQNNYTAFQTQSCSYIELEKGKFDAFYGDNDSKGHDSTIPPNANQFSMIQIMDVAQKSTTIERWNIETREEEKSDARWVLDYPLERKNFVYTYSRKAMSAAPRFSDTSIKYVQAIQSHRGDEKVLQGIAFEAATHKDLVHEYDVTITAANGTDYNYKYFSDFYLGTKNMEKIVQIPLDEELKPGSYFVTVKALDSFGTYSANAVQGRIEIK